MASDQTFVEYICDQIGGAGDVSFKKMFGEYAIYLDAKVIALVCDNQFFLKPTEAGRALLPTSTEAPPYPGAKDYFLIEEDLEDRDLMSRLLQATFSELPEPKPKKRKSQKSKKA